MSKALNDATQQPRKSITLIVRQLIQPKIHSSKESIVGQIISKQSIQQQESKVFSVIIKKQ